MAARSGALLLAVSLSLLPPSRASAGDAAAVRSAQEHVTLAAGFFKRGHFAQALQELRQANDLVPHPDYLYNMGRCYEEMGQPADAVEHFTRFLENGRDADKRAKAREAVLRLVPTAFGSVEVTCDPPDASVRIEGVAEGPCPLRLDRVRAGSWRVVASAAGRVGRVALLVVEAGKQARIQLALGREPGRLDVSSEPPGARVLVDGVDLGLAPLQGIDLPEGPHEVTLELAGHGRFAERIHVRPGETARVEGVLAQRKAHVRIRSEPSGALVRVGGRESGRTPIDALELAPGTYDVELEAPWHSGWRRRVQLAPEQTVELHGELRSRVTAWALTGTTAVVALGAAACYGLALSTIDDRDASKDAYDLARDRGGADALAGDVLAAEASANTLLVTSRILAGLAGALAGASVGAFILTGPVEEAAAGGRVGR